MALKFSTGLVNAIAGLSISRTDGGSEIAFVNGTGKITDTTSAFITDGFRPGDVILVASSDSGTNDGLYSVTSVASTGADMVVSPAPTDEAAAAASPVITARSKSFVDLFKYGVLRVYSGSQPSNADAAETGTQLLEITVDAGAFTVGTSTYGLQFSNSTVSGGIVYKAAADTWQDAGLAAGTAGYFRFYDNGRITGASTTAIRFDGSVGTSGAQLNLASTSVTVGATVTIDTFYITFPKS